MIQINAVSGNFQHHIFYAGRQAVIDYIFILHLGRENAERVQVPLDGIDEALAVTRRLSEHFDVDLCADETVIRVFKRRCV